MTETARPTGRPRSPDPMRAVTFRVPRSVLAGLDGIVWQRQQADPAFTRQDLARELFGAAVVGRGRSKKRG